MRSHDWVKVVGSQMWNIEYHIEYD
jgi:hypothetical protein